MNDFFASPLVSHTVLQIAAQAYGSDAYSSNNYNGTGTAPSPTPTPAATPTPTTSTTGPAAPLTGYFAEPPIFTFPLLLVGAIIIGTASFLISRRLRQRRQK